MRAREECSPPRQEVERIEGEGRRKLGREVAIEVLPKHCSDDAELE